MPPTAPHQDPQSQARDQPRRRKFRRPRRRRCLLKGCCKKFDPPHWRSRYCSEECAQAARRWSRWRAQQTYRATENGREMRRDQSRKYREERKARVASKGLVGRQGQSCRFGARLAATGGVARPREPGGLPSNSRLASRTDPSPGTANFDLVDPLALSETRASEGGEGNQKEKNLDRPCCRCSRPGCYEFFAVPKRSPMQRFCSEECRRALRRVLDRERQWIRRARWRDRFAPLPFIGRGADPPI